MLFLFIFIIIVAHNLFILLFTAYCLLEAVMVTPVSSTSSQKLHQVTGMSTMDVNEQKQWWQLEEVSLIHYENFPMQYTEIFSAVEIENFSRKFLIYLLKTLIMGTQQRF